MDFKEKVVIVTGGGRGIGRAYAHSFANVGAKVCIAELRDEAGRQVAKELMDQGAIAFSIQTDVADEGSVVEMVAQTVRTYGHIDVLVNNAGLFADDVDTFDPIHWDLLTGPMAQWRKIMAVNVEGVLHGMRAVAPYMKEQGQGKIINQSSVGSYMNGGAYGTSKLAVISITRAFAVELSPYGVNVNAIAPGIIASEAVTNRGARSQNELEAYLASYEERIPWGRVGQPKDLTGCVLWLASDASDYVTGQTISVDGGWIPRI